MGKYPNIAKGFVKGDRTEVEKLWHTLAADLNSIGPPKKTPEAWKKAWSDKKSEVKRKLVSNKKEARATGGGPHNQLYISSSDEAIGKLCGLYDIVDGIEDCVAFGFQAIENQEEPSMNSSSLGDGEDDQTDELPCTSSQPLKRKVQNHSLQDNLKKFIIDETTVNKEISITLRNLQSNLEKNSETQKQLELNSKRVYRALGKMTDSFKAHTKAIKEQTEEIFKQRIESERQHKEVEKPGYEKNLLKKDLEEQS